ncbi:CBS domain-containing protein [Amycolatopsis alkalitolerans]|uniref:CBS domain-containing protein n=1 Tax=Amycolatopsis alkalitolerans TaxID=2547244 RepID=A0A5C4LSU8_9PSEU|nr:CBS domain-containing protein [Amycolatopsis alkalitolerans]TNC20061.1 CBS domain-containing protein [Amycolatopsis alkalitolerans]
MKPSNVDAAHTVATVMTGDVAAVRRATPVKEIVALMSRRAVSGVPVLDGDRHVLGVVSEADLLPKESDHRTDPPRWWQRGLRSKVNARTAGQLMTAPAITVEDSCGLAAAARLLRRHAIRRLPVVDKRGRLVGIVSRRDLLTVFLRNDTEIAAEVNQRILTSGMLADRTEHPADVLDGVAILRGRLARKSMLPTAISLARDTDGVLNVISHLTYALDDGR